MSEIKTSDYKCWTNTRNHVVSLVFLSVFVRKRSSVNGSFDATKTDTDKNGVVWTGPQAETETYQKP